MKLAFRKNLNQTESSSFDDQVGSHQLDQISYSGLKEEGDYLEIDGQYIRTLYIFGYPFTASSGWLNQLVTFNHNIDLSYHIEPISPTEALPKLNRKITELISTQRAMQRSGQVVSPELLDPLESAIALRDKILRGQENLLQVSIYISIFASSLTELDQTTTILESILAARLFYSKNACYQQLAALTSTLPYGDNQLAQRRNLDSSSAALLFPFVSSELAHQTGVLYGINRSNNSLVILDRFALPNANSILFAQSGSGKSYTAKVEILRSLMLGTRVIVIDPEEEYRRISSSVNGAYIPLALNSSLHVNPFDLSINAFTDHEDFADHVQALTEIISLMAGGMSEDEKAVIDEAILKTYEANGWDRSNGIKQRGTSYPLLGDLYLVLKRMKQPKLCQRLQPYTTGSLAHIFNSQTNINLDNRLVVFGTKDLPESVRQIMHLVIAQFVSNQVKAHSCKRLLVIDEGWILLEHEESARFIASLVRRARKYYLGVSIITQQANDFLQNSYGRAIASQSSLRILMRQDTTTITSVVAEFRLSGYEERFLLTCNRGEALIIADQDHATVKVCASPAEHPLITTDPAELSLQAHL